ncbi:hypothetical protein ANN_08781 [Periplaneta americana]|uniref:Per a allergen n=1 Tax=Periplaneta americana TaxID=6978 RepID=A0ABQ8T2D8_PERAM|nr:hypothetical protein ANN_08781 [Periplaneta americana]
MTDFQVAAEWHFFATSHGKSLCDSVGGTLKRLAVHANLWGTQITDSKELYEWAKTNIPGVDISFTGKEQHENEDDILNNDRFLRLKTVLGTRSIHCVVPVCENKITIKSFSSSSEVPKEVTLSARRSRGRRGEAM